MNAANLLRWSARLWSLASLGFVGLFILGHRGFPISAETILFPIGVLAGLVLAWRWEALGGAITTVSIATFYAIHIAAVGHPPRGPWLLLVAAPGVLFLASGLLRHMRSRPRAITAS